MALGWKVLIPVSIVWLLLIATVRAWRYDTHDTAVYVVGGVVLAIIIVIAVSWDVAAERRAARAAEAEAAALEAEPEPGATRVGDPRRPGDLPGPAARPAPLPRRWGHRPVPPRHGAPGGRGGRRG